MPGISSARSPCQPATRSGVEAGAGEPPVWPVADPAGAAVVLAVGAVLDGLVVPQATTTEDSTRASQIRRYPVFSIGRYYGPVALWARSFAQTVLAILQPCVITGPGRVRRSLPGFASRSALTLPRWRPWMSPSGSSTCRASSCSKARGPGETLDGRT